MYPTLGLLYYCLLQNLFEICVYLCLPNPIHLGKVSPTFQAALFSVDARFARKIERPQKGIKLPVTTKWKQSNETASSEQTIQSKKTCKYVEPSSDELFKTSMFLKIHDNSTIN